ncbi:MAG: hypothetical protein WCT29_01010 [Candidatus Paceibacterota bacterium]|jgi:hypothetical protein
MREFVEDSQIVEKKLKKDYLKNFIVLKYSWLEETPAEIADGLLGNSRASLSKYTPQFFEKVKEGALRGVLALVKMKIIKNPEIEKQCEEFMQFVEELKREKFSKKELASREDIDKANKFLDLAIAQLEK